MSPATVRVLEACKARVLQTAIPTRSPSSAPPRVQLVAKTEGRA